VHVQPSNSIGSLLVNKKLQSYLCYLPLPEHNSSYRKTTFFIRGDSMLFSDFSDNFMRKPTL